MKKLNAAVVGLGASYWLHCMPIKELPEMYDFKYICDIDPKKIKKFEEDFPVKGVTDFSEVLSDGTIDVVAVATPCRFHKELAVKALNAGKHVVVEKPIAASVEEAEEMITAAGENKRLLTVYHERRLYPDHIFVDETVESGKLGKIIAIRCAVPVAPATLERVERWPKEGSGVDCADAFVLSNAYDMLVHNVDAVLAVMNKPVKEVYCRAGKYPGHLIPVNWEIQINFEDGPLAMVESRLTCCDNSLFYKWEVYGTDGTLLMQYTNEMGKTIVSCKDKDGQVAAENYDARDCSDREPFREYYRRVYDSIVNGKDVFVKAEEGRDAIKVLWLAFESLRTGAVIPWKGQMRG